MSIPVSIDMTDAEWFTITQERFDRYQIRCHNHDVDPKWSAIVTLSKEQMRAVAQMWTMNEAER